MNWKEWFYLEETQAFLKEVKEVEQSSVEKLIEGSKEQHDFYTGQVYGFRSILTLLESANEREEV